MKYGSVCSGIEAASKAWEPLGWKPAWFSEIEPFPSAVLAHHWPDVTNLGDMTKIADAVRAGDVEAPDVLVGGTPCQAFSIAGLREGLSDDRGQLTLSYVELANAIDAKRRERGEPESIIVWENVPGVLSSKDNAFGCFLAGLAGESSELQPAGGKWTHAGCVSGPERVIAWRVLDAQFFGVAQRRRRVFVVASARKGFDPAAVLFELDSVRRDTAPRRETQKAVAALTARGVGTCGADGNQAQAGHLIAMTHDQGGDEIKTDDPASELTCNHEAPIAAYGIPGNWIGRAPENGGNATEPMVDVSPCLTVADRHGVAYAFAENSHGEARLQDGDGGITGPLSTGGGKPGQGYPAVVAFQERGRADGRSLEINGDLAYALTAPNGGGRAQERNIADFRTMAVRRLTPIECERLQGFPDNHTLIGWRGKDTAECPDGPRYKAIGNSMAVPVMRWIGERIAAALPIEEPTPRNWQRPFLKWAGGKYSLLPELDRLIPAGKRLVEPFVGGGSVFLNSEKHESFLLADVNADLINLYQMLEVDHIRVCSLAKILFERANSEVAYKELRDEFNNQRMGAPERAAAFLFLNRHCFNGLIRYNRDGFFNVGWGKYEAPYFPEIEIKAFKQKSHKCVFLNAGYRRTLALAGEGDVVYCDPPYEPLPGTAGFTNYAAGGFSWADQISLAESCVAAHQRGAKVLINNSTAPRVLELYEQHGFILHHVDARRAISSKGSTRETAKDIVATLGV
ncbi:Dam family site-specific DNA-(adenine-N6)-methyltransferase [Enterobacter hormaechei]|uniref:Dam family site-specific DNA-(adenine-N6)-methyltransferase n=1 Tax=Enterobacter hormaechei TaxID=158836 RepID=UPI00063C6D23|nr:Dam family site-specific DNA-(adenine-N6)-methyltransferase [Enterobacter hormaechei]ELT7763214.1 Dam family site-specific DNA-(adenine-N6)-methyltransferase [Enterobacter hormaechei]ELZ9367398.1 Dam family site-specific DNA-(adenine-N6)-methyltransferase [Enterobacter hormaechei]KLF82719.1 DNA (cytosine-5-)-methyltransferase [Enterobacter hormaechei subsp. oharae]MBK1484867.1 Dam family site-specific DNA-(adenine-N6)-methyltransferase [Enterobacter hormaechei]QLS10191.1 Dam family site-spe